MQTETPDRILWINTVLDRTGLSRSTMYRKMQDGTFPKNVQISTRCVGRREPAIDTRLRNPMFFRVEDLTQLIGRRQIIAGSAEVVACRLPRPALSEAPFDGFDCGFRFIVRRDKHRAVSPINAPTVGMCRQHDQDGQRIIGMVLRFDVAARAQPLPMFRLLDHVCSKRVAFDTAYR